MFVNAAGTPALFGVKICGITTRADAIAAVEAGADALGWNLYPRSRRFIDIRDASPVVRELADSVQNVAVMVNPTLADATAAASVFAALQLHGSEAPQFCETLAAAGIIFAKALPVIDEKSLLQTPSFSTPVVVLDSSAGGQFGGTGKIFSWDLAAAFKAAFPRLRIVLAGGLTPENVAEAVRRVRPAGVDVTTGVEASPGRKDHGLLRAFVQAARGA